MVNEITRNAVGVVSKSERGAALVTVLLISTMLLILGGGLILTTSYTGTNTIDSSSEMQAYYAAEAGLQATLNVLRGSVLPNPLFVANPAGSVAPENKITLKKAVDPLNSNLTTDPQSAFPARLSRWLSYNYTPTGNTYADRVAISQNYTPLNGMAYSIVISDPDNKAPQKPLRVQIVATGYGPRGARKSLTMLVSAYGLDFAVPATLTFRGHDDHSTDMVVNLGASNAKDYSGIDNATADPQRPAIAVNNHDTDVIETAYAPKPSCVTDPKYAVLDLPGEPAPPLLAVPPPYFLKTADDARAFVAQLTRTAQRTGRVLSTCPNSALGTTASPELVVVTGDCTLNDGAGMLLVQGTLYFDGPGPNYKGIILVLGNGSVVKQGGGNKDIFGAIVVAKFGATGGFLAPSFVYGGTGTSNLQFDSAAYRDAMMVTGHATLGVVEK
jgi:Tfp pilus assembly protein PilX